MSEIVRNVLDRRYSQIGDQRAYYEATEEQRAAWNRYAQEEADKFSDTLSANESIGQYTGHDREGRITSWCPPLYFPEWMVQQGD